MQLDLEKSKRRMAHLLMLAGSDPAEYSRAVGGATSVVVDFFPFVIKSQIHDSVSVREDGSFKAFVFAPDLSAVQAFRVSGAFQAGELVQRLVTPFQRVAVELRPGAFINYHGYAGDVMFEFMRGVRQTLTFGGVRHPLGKSYEMLDEVFPARHNLAVCAFPRVVTTVNVKG